MKVVTNEIGVSIKLFTTLLLPPLISIPAEVTRKLMLTLNLTNSLFVDF